MKKLGNAGLVLAILALVYINARFFPEFWGEQFAPVIAYVSDFFGFLGLLFRSIIYGYLILWLAHFFVPKSVLFVMEFICWFIALVSPKLANILLIPFEDKEEKKKKEKAEKKKEALKTLAEDD